MDKNATDRFRELVREHASELLILEDVCPDVWRELQEEFVPSENPRQLRLILGGKIDDNNTSN